MLGKTFLVVVVFLSLLSGAKAMQFNEFIEYLSTWDFQMF